MTTIPNRYKQRAPGIGLSRFGLTLLLVLVFCLPPLAGLVLSRSLPPARDRLLALQIQLHLAASGGKALCLINESQDELRCLRVQINEAFHYLPPDSLTPAAQIELPLHWFAKKNGKRFDPEKWKIDTVRVSARLPNNHNAATTKQF